MSNVRIAWQRSEWTLSVESVEGGLQWAVVLTESQKVELCALLSQWGWPTAIEERPDRPRMGWWHLVLLVVAAFLAGVLKASSVGAESPWAIAALGLVFYAVLLGVLTLFARVRTLMRP